MTVIESHQSNLRKVEGKYETYYNNFFFNPSGTDYLWMTYHGSLFPKADKKYHNCLLKYKISDPMINMHNGHLEQHCLDSLT